MPNPHSYWLYAHTLSQSQTRVGILYQDPLHPLALPKRIIVELPLPRVDAELTVILELLKRTPSTQQIEIQLPLPSITVKLLRTIQYQPTQNQVTLLNQIETEHKRICQHYHNLSVSECPFNRVGFLRNLKDLVTSQD
jgi:hypothetical protein